MEVIFYADLLGTFAFSITGIIGSIRHQIDPIGAFFLAFATAMGGGIIRDMLLGVPSSTFNNPYYLATVFVGFLFTYLFINKIKELYQVFLFLDAFGLAIFTLIGIEKSISLNVHFLGSILAGTLTAVGGGVIRDTLIGDIPFIFHKEIYAVPSLIGGIVFYCVYKLNFLPLIWNILLSATLILGLRLWGYKKNIRLPRFYR
jgi:uncharacterized membrane protein YeiH